MKDIVQMPAHACQIQEMSQLSLHPAHHHRNLLRQSCLHAADPGLSPGQPHNDVCLGLGLIAYCCAGLDANAALVVTQCISRLCTSGDHLVIASIHQPRAAIWDLFNRVVLLSEGYTLYCGPTADVRPLLHHSALHHTPKQPQHSSWGGLAGRP